MEGNLTGIRGKQVVGLLREHGPLSGRVIESLLDPPIAKRKCQEVLQRLKSAGLIERLEGHFPDTAGSYYALPRSRGDKKRLASFLGVEAEDFQVCFVRDAELRHGSQCAIWAEYFKKIYPESKVVRDWEMTKYPEIVGRLAGLHDEFIYPDIFLLFKGGGSAQRIVVAIEVERTLKTIERLKVKTKAMVYQTSFDGVLYVCSDYRIAEAVRSAFLSQEVQRSQRIGGYVDDFILYTNYEALSGPIGSYCVNSRLVTREIHEWLSYLRLIPMRDRTSSSLGSHRHSYARHVSH
jgi:hypothetical protein